MGNSYLSNLSATLYFTNKEAEAMKNQIAHLPRMTQVEPGLDSGSHLLQILSATDHLACKVASKYAARHSPFLRSLQMSQRPYIQ